jgi:hypothetical protein
MTVRGDGVAINDLPIALRVFESRVVTDLSTQDVAAYF